MAFIYVLPALTNWFQGFFRGMGRMPITIVMTSIQIVLRTTFTYLLAPRLGIRGIAFACAIGWTVMIACAYLYYRRIRREEWGANA